VYQNPIFASCRKGQEIFLSSETNILSVCSPHSHRLKVLPKALSPGWSDRDMKWTAHFPLVSSLRMIFPCPCDDGLHSVDHFGVFTSPRTHSAPEMKISRWMLFTETFCVISKNHAQHAVTLRDYHKDLISKSLLTVRKLIGPALRFVVRWYLQS